MTARLSFVPPIVADHWRTASSRAVHPSGRDDGDSIVLAVAEGLAAVAVPWELAAGDSPYERRHALLLATEVYDAWLIHWPPGTGLVAHDHGDSCGALAVVSGTLDEDTVVDDHAVTKRIGPGESISFDAGHIHAVTNRGASSVTSVHVYSPPLRTMGYYRQGPDGSLIVVAPTRSRAMTSAIGAIRRARRDISILTPSRRRARSPAPCSSIRDRRPTRRVREIPGAIVIERNVLEWRLDPTSEHRHPADETRLFVVIAGCCPPPSAKPTVATTTTPDVHDLAGGFSAWTAAGLPVEP
jgi:quercetin dioxygenase-like cupin family protein